MMFAMPGNGAVLVIKILEWGSLQVTRQHIHTQTSPTHMSLLPPLQKLRQKSG